ncbi:hypothetical protein OTU49_010340, partial [Cherax quadricarinatus]
RPASVVIRPPTEPLVEGSQTRLECVAAGAYPSAVIVWEKTLAGRSTVLKATSLRLGEVTSSWLTLVPEAEDHGATLTCRAHNPNIPVHAATTSTALQITFAPRVTLRLGYNLQTRPVTEGEDVYFECEVASNPPPHAITWYKDVSTGTSRLGGDAQPQRWCVGLQQQPGAADGETDLSWQLHLRRHQHTGHHHQ